MDWLQVVEIASKYKDRVKPLIGEPKMLMTNGELLDKYSILLIKNKHGLPVEKEVQECCQEADGLLQGKYIKQQFNELYRVNNLMWILEDAISTKEDLDSIGVLCLALRSLKMDRNRIKNAIHDRYCEPTEHKKYK